jgi:hypothetical protein
MDRLSDYVHFAPRNQTNSLIGLNTIALGSRVPSRIEGIRRDKMKLTSVRVSVFLATCALCQSAIAQTPECRSIADSATRLACYDKGARPVAPSAAARPVLRATPSPKVDSTQYVDSISAEDAIMNAKIKGICHGC